VVADSNWSRDLGVRLGAAARKQGNLAGDTHTIGLAGTLNDSFTIANGGTVPLLTPNVDLGIANPAGRIAMSLLNNATGNLLSLELQALEADNRGKIISNPRVMTSNQKPAVILNGTQLPYIAVTNSGGVSATTVTFKDVFLCLLVDPQILNNDSLIMTVEVQKDALDANNSVTIPGSGTTYPAIATKRVKTQVRVNNGETLVLGGIFDQAEINNVTKVPFLGDVPVLGNLFKTTSKSDGKTELIIFITPRILDDRLSLR
jgi:type IV pilus assembly protein PilQ